MRTSIHPNLHNLNQSMIVWSKVLKWFDMIIIFVISIRYDLYMSWIYINPFEQISTCKFPIINHSIDCEQKFAP